MQLSAERPPLALIACNDDWMSRALESVFQQHGYVVAHTRSGAQALELAKLANHDLLVVDESLGDVTALEVCREIRDGARYDHSIPLLVTATTPPDPACVRYTRTRSPTLHSERPLASIASYESSRRVSRVSR